jgi:asparagine synthase (glutamine-hydrolysing)
MCGICGSFSSDGLPEQDTSSVIQMTKLMERRGPDDEGFWTDGKHCALGFRRLSILDLSPAGHQPMTTPDGRYTIAYNGEVYNFRELRKQLEQSGVQFRSTGDSEVVLNALALWGKAALDRFNGMFALAFYDRIERRLLLARDHAGIKPLYYLHALHGIVFASQYDQILSHPWSRGLGVSPDALALYLRLGYIPAPYAILKQSHMLEPGAWLEVDVASPIKAGRFFELPVFHEPELHGEEAYEAVDVAVTRAVRRHLVSDVPVGTFLSGGVDSPLVAAKAKAANNGAVRAFTISTNGDQLDESPDAIAYAREIGMDHVVDAVAPRSVPDMLNDVVGSCGEPFADYSIFPTLQIARVARRHVKVILSGDGGDELFWGYPGRFIPVLKDSRAFAYPHWVRAIRSGFGRVLGNGNSGIGYPSIGDWYRARHARVSEHQLHGIFPEAPKWPADCDLFTFSGSETGKAAQWLRWNEFTSHLTMVLLKVDRASMHHSLEVRVPLLDRELIEVAARVDWRSCLDLEAKIGKLPLRKSLARHVHHQTKAKRGFEAPMNAWLGGPLQDIFRECVIKPKDLLGMPINQESLHAMFEAHVAGQSNHTRALWTLLSLALWEQKHYRTHRTTSPDSIQYGHTDLPVATPA